MPRLHLTLYADRPGRDRKVRLRWQGPAGPVDAWVEVARAEGDRVQLCVDAPPEVEILRESLIRAANDGPGTNTEGENDHG